MRSYRNQLPSLHQPSQFRQCCFPANTLLWKSCRNISSKMDPACTGSCIVETLYGPEMGFIINCHQRHVIQFVSSPFVAQFPQTFSLWYPPGVWILSTKRLGRLSEAFSSRLVTTYSEKTLIRPCKENIFSFVYLRMNVFPRNVDSSHTLELYRV